LKKPKVVEVEVEDMEKLRSEGFGGATIVDKLTPEASGTALNRAKSVNDRCDRHEPRHADAQRILKHNDDGDYVASPTPPKKEDFANLYIKIAQIAYRLIMKTCTTPVRAQLKTRGRGEGEPGR